MLRPGRGRSGELPTNYGGGGATVSAPPAAGYYGGYGARATPAPPPPPPPPQQQTMSHMQPQSYGGYRGGASAGGRPASTATTIGRNGGMGGSGSSHNSSKDKHRRGRSNGPSAQKDPVGFVVYQLKQPIVWTTALAVIFFLTTIKFRSDRNWIFHRLGVSTSQDVAALFQDTQRQGQDCRRQLGEKQTTEKRLGSQITVLERENQRMAKERDELLVRQAGRLQDREERARLEYREMAWKGQVELLQNATQRESKRAATEKFGPGPHRVQFAVVLPSDETETEHYFVVEMAPLAIMPHAVHLFLEQVAHGLWNNAWWYLNGPHVLQGGPQAEDEVEDEEHAEEQRNIALKPWRDAGLDTLFFPEYSEAYPHEKWTLGMTGRPGGPDIYINKMNNTEAHGPGGQHQHELEEMADPCFARVVDGFDVLSLIFDEHTYPDHHEWGWFYEEPVHIVGAKVLNMPKPPQTLSGSQPEQQQQQQPLPQSPEQAAADLQQQQPFVEPAEQVQHKEEEQPEQTQSIAAESEDWRHQAQQQSALQMPEQLADIPTAGDEASIGAEESRRKPKKPLQKYHIEHQVVP